MEIGHSVGILTPWSFKIHPYFILKSKLIFQFIWSIFFHRQIKIWLSWDLFNGLNSTTVAPVPATPGMDPEEVKEEDDFHPLSFYGYFASGVVKTDFVTAIPHGQATPGTRHVQFPCNEVSMDFTHCFPGMSSLGYR